MKPQNSFLKEIRAWPEEGRKLLAGALFLISIAVMFVLWSQGVTQNLSAISRSTEQTVEDPYNETPEAPGPLIGIAQTLGSIREFFR